MLEVKNLTVGYGKQTVLNCVSITIKKGKMTAIIGVNGSGKSTFLKSLLGIIPNKSGEIIIDGVNSSSLKRGEVAKRISYLSQGKNSPDMTVMQMVLHGRFPYLSYPRRYTAKDREIALLALEKVGLLDCADKPLNELSGGMRQNAYIAMAFAQDTGYILLDEPTTYLDISNQLSLMKTLTSLKDEGKGIAVVMHDISMAFEFCDELIVINDGKIVLNKEVKTIDDFSLLEDIFGVKINRFKDCNRIYYSY